MTLRQVRIPHNIGERNAAKLRGDSHYYTGTECSRGHVALRKTSDGGCLECLKENASKRRLARTPEQIEKDKLYARENVKKWLEKNKDTAKDKIKENKKRWKTNNVGVVRADTIKRRASKLQRTPAWLDDGHLFEMECIYKYCAALRSIGLDYHVDHIVPMQGRKVSGLHAPWNLQVISAQENLSKGNRHYG